MKSPAGKYYIFLIAFAVIYAAIVFTTPPDPDSLERFNLAPLKYYLILGSLSAAIIVIWALIFLGFIKLKNYADLIKSQPDAEPISKLATGLAIWAFSSPVSSIISSSFTYLRRTAKLSGNSINILGSEISVETLNVISTVTGKYISLLIAIAAFYFITLGAKGFLKNLNSGSIDPLKKFTWNAAYFLMAGLYIYTVLNDPYRQSPAIEGGRAAFYLPDYLIVFTIILPYLYVWYNGFQSAITINEYSRNVPGVIYKKALGLVANGIIAVILASIFTQFLASSSGVIANLGLGAILLIIYVLFAIIAIGYTLIAMGAGKLTKIEQV